MFGQAADGRRPRGVVARVQADLEPYVFINNKVRRRPYDELDPGALDLVAAQLRCSAGPSSATELVKAATPLR